MGLVGAVGLLVCAAVLVGVICAAARGDLDSNGLIGIRTRATRASDAAWLAGHRAAVRPAKQLAVICTVFAVAMVVAGVVSGSSDPTVTVTTLYALGYTVLLVGAAHLAMTADHAAKATLQE